MKKKLLKKIFLSVAVLILIFNNNVSINATSKTEKQKIIENLNEFITHPDKLYKEGFARSSDASICLDQMGGANTGSVIFDSISYTINGDDITWTVKANKVIQVITTEGINSSEKYEEIPTIKDIYMVTIDSGVDVPKLEPVYFKRAPANNGELEIIPIPYDNLNQTGIVKGKEIKFKTKNNVNSDMYGYIKPPEKGSTQVFFITYANYILPGGTATEFYGEYSCSNKIAGTTIDNVIDYQDGPIDPTPSPTPKENEYVTCKDGDFWGCATNWVKWGDVKKLDGDAANVIKDVMYMIKLVGTAVIMLVTTALGIKYILASAEGKAEVKDSIVSLFIACLFFFGWDGISSIIMPGNELIFTKNTDSLSSIVAKVFSYSMFVLQFVMVAAVIYVGVKYLTSGASGKADLKSKSVQFIIGIIMAFATTSFLTYISNVINQVV